MELVCARIMAREGQDDGRCGGSVRGPMIWRGGRGGAEGAERFCLCGSECEMHEGRRERGQGVRVIGRWRGSAKSSVIGRWVTGSRRTWSGLRLVGVRRSSAGPAGEGRLRFSRPDIHAVEFVAGFGIEIDENLKVPVVMVLHELNAETTEAG